jgi:Holliday junction resolvase
VANIDDRQIEHDGDDPDDEWDFTYHHNPFVRELRRLKELNNHHGRGYEFQEFVANLFRYRHFKVTSNPGTARPRQTDLLATRGEDIYIIEVKWRITKANIDDIDSLFSRLEAAPSSAVGLMVSFPGFTASVIEKVEQRSDRPVLLMTGEEIERLIEWDEDLAHFLARKKNVLLTSRTAFFATTPRRQVSPQPVSLATSPAEFVLLDGSRVKYISGRGGFGEFTFTQDLPDIDWAPAEGYGVMLDMAVPVYDEHGIIALLQQLSSMGWATEHARWSIQQSATNWHGIGMSAFAEALQGWEERYKGIETHHSEEFCYFDQCDGGFYSLTANISAHETRSATRTMLSFQLAGVPLDTGPFKELSRIFDTGTSYYFRPMERPSVEKNMNLREPHQLTLEPVAFIAEQDDTFGAFGFTKELARGIVARNPFYSPNSLLAERQPNWLPSYIFDSELLICGLRSWHLLDDKKHQYRLWGCESARTADATIVCLVAEWDQ